MNQYPPSAPRRNVYMRQLIRFVIYIFYNYYKEVKGEEDIPYFWAITSSLTIFYVNLVTLFELFRAVYMLPGIQPGNKVERIFIFTVCYYLPMFWVIRWLSPEKVIEKLAYSEDSIIKGRVLVLIYIILSIIVLGIVFLK
jgi:hypothetical protein